jgi:hypothetical protein
MTNPCSKDQRPERPIGHFSIGSFIGHSGLVIGAFSWTASQPPILSWLVFLTLLLICGSSTAVFFLLVRRWTSQRAWATLADWARHRQIQFRPTEPEQLPPVLQPLRAAQVDIELHLSDETVSAFRLKTAPNQNSAAPNMWHVLVRRRPSRHSAPAALRPAEAARSLFDLFGLSQFPSLTLGHRFTLLATNSSAARALADSASRTLLPADIGLLLSEDWIVLDFSTRPFDAIELDRMIALAQQLSQLL